MSLSTINPSSRGVNLNEYPEWRSDLNYSPDLSSGCKKFYPAVVRVQNPSHSTCTSFSPTLYAPEFGTLGHLNAPLDQPYHGSQDLFQTSTMIRTPDSVGLKGQDVPIAADIGRNENSLRPDFSEDLGLALGGTFSMLSDPMGSSSQLGPTTTNHFDLSSISFSDSYTTMENASTKVLLPSRTTVPYRSVNMNCESLSTSRDVPFWEGQSPMDANFREAHISTVQLECSPLAPSAIWNRVQRGANSIHLDEEDSHATEEIEKEVFARDNSEIKGTSRMVSGRRYREYPCPECNKLFARPSTLIQHKRVHTGERPYHCPIENCPQTFNILSNARRHLKRHHNVADNSETFCKERSKIR